MSVLTTAEAASLFRVDVRTVVRWLRKKTLKGYKIGGVWRIDSSSIPNNLTVDNEKDGERPLSPDRIR